MNIRFSLRLLALLLVATQLVQAQSYTVLKHFGGGSDGSTPQAGLAAAGDVLYGTTWSGGTLDYGTIFKLNRHGTAFGVLKRFDWMSGSSPEGDLTVSGNTLYGTCSGGGNPANGGVVYRMNTNGSDYTVLMIGDFQMTTPLRVPRAGVVLLGTNLYCTAYGTFSLQSPPGCVFKVGTNGGPVQTFYSFPQGGGRPMAKLATSGDRLYGTTRGGSFSEGDVFTLGTNGGVYYLHYFNKTNGASPRAEVLILGDTLYGTTASGGKSNLGTIYKIKNDGTGFTTLKHFAGADGSSPIAGLVFQDQFLYGTTYDGGRSNLGTIYRLNTNGGDFQVLYHFNRANGANPMGTLVYVKDAFYGTASSGGLSEAGAVFRFSLQSQLTPSLRQNSLNLQWDASPGWKYQMQYKASLAGSYWSNWGTLITATNYTMSVNAPMGSDSQRLYRLMRVP